MKNITMILIAIVMSCTLNAQWSLGPRFGANFSGLTGQWSDNDDTETKWIGGLTGGAVAGYNFTDIWAMRGEFLYIPMGEKTVWADDGGRSINEQGYYLRERYNCLQMILVAQVLFNLNFMLIYANLGPFWTYKMGGVWSTAQANGDIDWGTNNSRSINETYYVDPEYNRRWDYGMYIGGGVGKELGPGILELDLRFGFGLVDLNKFENSDEKQQAKDNGYKPYRSMNFTVSLAYLYLFSK